MSTFFDKVQAGSHLLAAAVSLTLGISLVASGSWCLDRVLGAQSLIYFLSGYSAGQLGLSFQRNLSDVDVLLSDLMKVLKISCSTAILGGIFQIITSAIALRASNCRVTLITWAVTSIVSSALSLTSLILPLAYGLKNFLELHVLFTVAGLNTFIQIHLFAVMIIQIRSMENNAEGKGDDVEEPNSAEKEKSATPDLPTPPPTPPISPKSSPIPSTSTNSNANANANATVVPKASN